MIRGESCDAHRTAEPSDVVGEPLRPHRNRSSLAGAERALKIDRSFISGIASSNGSSALIHTLVRLGKTLGLETLGEGIEDEAQLRHLQREHCDQGQGFLARPLDLEQLHRFLAG